MHESFDHTHSHNGGLDASQTVGCCWWATTMECTIPFTLRFTGHDRAHFHFELSASNLIRIRFFSVLFSFPILIPIFCSGRCTDVYVIETRWDELYSVDWFIDGWMGVCNGFACEFIVSFVLSECVWRNLWFTCLYNGRTCLFQFEIAYETLQKNLFTDYFLVHRLPLSHTLAGADHSIDVEKQSENFMEKIVCSAFSSFRMFLLSSFPRRSTPNPCK